MQRAPAAINPGAGAHIEDHAARIALVGEPGRLRLQRHREADGCGGEARLLQGHDEFARRERNPERPQQLFRAEFPDDASW